jgi:hypothetical protein
LGHRGMTLSFAHRTILEHEVSFREVDVPAYILVAQGSLPGRYPRIC